jgi:hypothetical protein
MEAPLGLTRAAVGPAFVETAPSTARSSKDCSGQRGGKFLLRRPPQETENVEFRCRPYINVAIDHGGHGKFVGCPQCIP